MKYIEVICQSLGQLFYFY